MSKDTYLVAFDGDEDSGRLLDFAIDRAKRDNAHLIIAHVLEWSAYKFLTPTELEERHSRRKEEMQRGQDVILKPAVDKATAAGVEVEGKMAYGGVVETICAMAKDEKASLVMMGRSEGGISSRVFGSTTMGLSQTCPAPLVIVP